MNRQSDSLSRRMTKIEFDSILEEDLTSTNLYNGPCCFLESSNLLIRSETQTSHSTEENCNLILSDLDTGRTRGHSMSKPS